MTYRNLCGRRIEPSFVVYSGDDPTRHVFYHGAHRHNISKAQRAMSAAKVQA